MFLKNSPFEVEEKVKPMIEDAINVLSLSVKGQPVNNNRRKDAITIVNGILKEYQANTAYEGIKTQQIHISSESRSECELKLNQLGLLPKFDKKQLKEK